MSVSDNLAALRAAMKDADIDYYVVGSSDYHDSEYVGAYFRAREFLSGFTGSNGTLLVSATEAWLWTDGRYFLQAEEELKGSGIQLMKAGRPGVPKLYEHLGSIIRKDETLGLDGRHFCVTYGEQLEKTVLDVGAFMNCEADLITGIWTDRPALSCEPVFILDEKYTGKASSLKLKDIRDAMLKENCSLHILTSLDDIAWILNLRGADVECNPVFLSYLTVTPDSGTLYIQENALNASVKSYIEELGLNIRPYDSLYEDMKDKDLRGTSVMVDKDRLNFLLYKLLLDHTELKDIPNPSQALKACKNETERLNLRKANEIDGAAMVKFLHWLDDHVGKTDITEISAADRLESFRREGEGYMGPSFTTISGYNAHGAIIHYEPTPDTDIPVYAKGFLLVDSGGQYLTGTTDITRTVSLGEVTDIMRHHYTMVLRAHVNLARVRFHEGVSGSNLDILARIPFWEEGLDYEHGTGHGIGYYLNVHEGPASIHWNTVRQSTRTALAEGMVLSDEPGIYIAGEYGIRIENDLLVRKDIETEYGRFMNFEELTLCPIDLRPVNFNEMTEEEIDFLDKYHSMVVERLSPYLNESDRAWLENAVRH
ncbi:MAG: aminopeptidase P family protein [Lachnospiraceae bacterium]|nr:aminopeptidase P family protein [Lachnospiraceae bacterium]